MQDYALIMLAGALGSFHCVGMCGGFACAIGYQQSGWRSTLQRLVLYNLGRLTTYVFLGAVGGLLGMQIMAGGTSLFSVSSGQRILAVVSGLLMLLMGFQLLGWMPRFKISRINPGRLFFGVPPLADARLGGGTASAGFSLAKALQATVSRPGVGASLALGVFNGFLPCPLVYAFLAQAAGSLEPAKGMVIMALFALGTFPAMLVIGVLGQTLGTSWRKVGVTLAGGMVAALGVVTLLRGLLALDAYQMSHALLFGPLG